MKVTLPLLYESPMVAVSHLWDSMHSSAIGESVHHLLQSHHRSTRAPYVTTPSWRDHVSRCWAKSSSSENIKKDKQFFQQVFCCTFTLKVSHFRTVGEPWAILTSFIASVQLSSCSVICLLFSVSIFVTFYVCLWILKEPFIFCLGGSAGRQWDQGLQQKKFRFVSVKGTLPMHHMIAGHRKCSVQLGDGKVPSLITWQCIGGV